MIGNSKTHNNQKGMTILELMVAFFVFAIVVIMATSIFINAMGGQRKTQAQQDSLDNIRYALETIAKEVRMSREPSIPDVVPANSVLQVKAVKAGNVVIDYIEYKLEDGRVKRGGSAITSDNVEITDLKFYLIPDDTGDHHPGITIIMKAKVTGIKPGEGSEITLQTTVSLRNYSN